MRAAKAAILGVGLVAIATSGVVATHDDYYHHVEPTYWQGFKNAMSDMNPFTSNLGHDWADTQHRVENIYHDTQRNAQRQVAELKEDTFKDNKELQQKIADIYLQAAQDAENRIERLKRPLFGALFPSGARDEHDDESSSWWPGSSTHRDTGAHVQDETRHMYDRAKDYVRDTKDYVRDTASNIRDTARDTATGVKKRLAPHEKAGLLETATKKMSESYRSAVDKAKDMAAKAPSVAGETLKDAKRRAMETYEEHYGRGHHEARTTFQNLREKLGYGLSKAGGVASGAAYKTWHLMLHMFLGAFWLTVGAVAYGGIKWWIEKQTFKKQLAAPIQGPVVLSKVFTVFGTEDTQRKFQEYWNNAAAQFFSRQPGLRKFSLQRGIDVGSATWGHLSEWNSIEDLRRALAQPELTELKKRMPGGVMSKRGISQVISTGKGGAGTTGGAPQEGDVVRGEGLRNRGPGTTSQ